MIGDKINIKSDYLSTAGAILRHKRLQTLLNEFPRLVIAIGGESGSGKSVTAICLHQLLEDAGIHAAVLHQDDYFKLPPLDNHNRRLLDINWVGTGEVRLDLLSSHLTDFINQAATLNKPLSNYERNEITEETIKLENCRVLIVEGTYTLLLPESHYRIFIERNYIDTLPQRLERGRDTIDEFSNKVLAIEHHIIAPLISTADAIVGKDYQVRFTD